MTMPEVDNPNLAEQATVCPYCAHHYVSGVMTGYVYCPACGKRFNPDSLTEETAIIHPLIPTNNEPSLDEDKDFTPLDEESEARRFGDYDVLAEIARGGMGVVYRARHRLLKRIVALKVLRAGNGATEEDISRFMQEAKAVASLSHPNIVPIHELSIEQGQYFFTMNYIEGWSLDHLIERQKFPPYRVCEIIEIVARAIHYAHTKGIIHRDIKPANVIMAEDGRPMLTDFGLAVNLSLSRNEERMTRDGSIMGTIPYIPPEQAAGRLEEISPRSDVYSLGALFYEMLTQRPPFTGMTQYELLQRVINQYPPLPRKINPRINADMETICMKCLAKEPEQRYQTALELAEDCRALLNGEIIKARPRTFFYRVQRLAKRYPTQTALGVAILLLGLALLSSVSFVTKQREELIKSTVITETMRTEKDKLTERVERRWREDFKLQFSDDNLTSNRNQALDKQIGWRNSAVTKIDELHSRLSISSLDNLNDTAFGAPINLPQNFRVDSKFTVLRENAGRVEILLGVRANFTVSSDFTYVISLGTRNSPGAVLWRNQTPLAENNHFFLETDRVYQLEITQAIDNENLEGDKVVRRKFALLINGEEILTTLLPPETELPPEAYFAVSVRNMHLELLQFDVNIPGLNQEMIKNLMEIGNSLSAKSDEQPLARSLYRRVLRERVPVNVLLQVYLGFAKTVAALPTNIIREEFNKLTEGLPSNRNIRELAGELSYGYGLILSMTNNKLDAEKSFRDAYEQAVEIITVKEKTPPAPPTEKDKNKTPPDSPTPPTPSVKPEKIAWEQVNVFGLLARLDEAFMALLRGDYVTASGRFEKLHQDNIVTILREKYAAELHTRLALSSVWQKLDGLLVDPRKPTAQIVARDSNLSIAVGILEMIRSLDLKDAVRIKELAKHYYRAANIYEKAAGREKITAEKITLLYHAEKLLSEAEKLANDWYLPLYSQAAFFYGQSARRAQAYSLFATARTRFPDNIDLRLAMVNFYLDPEKMDFYTGEILPPEPERALPIAEELLTLSGNKNPVALELYARTLLQLNKTEKAWHINEEAIAIEETPERLQLRETIRLQLPEYQRK